MNDMQRIIYPHSSWSLTSRDWRAGRSVDSGQDLCIFDGLVGSSASRNGALDLGLFSEDFFVSMASNPPGEQTAKNARSERLDSPDSVSPQLSEGRSEPDIESTFQFVNTTEPSSLKDPKLRKLVKSHVKKRSDLAKLKCRGSRDSSSASSSKSEPSRRRKSDQAILAPFKGPSPTSSSPGSSLPNSATYDQNTISFAMTTKDQSLLDCYLNVVGRTYYPFEDHLAYSPVRKGWLSLVLKDEVLFRAVLFSAAAHLSSETQRIEFDPDALIQPIFKHLNTRLQTKEPMTDTTIGIVSCLAMSELAREHYDQWNIHMNAIKEMVRQRGGLQNLDESLQLKLNRGDVEGAVDCVVTPHLVPFHISVPPTYSLIPAIQPVSSPAGMQNALVGPDVCFKLRESFARLWSLSRAIDFALGTRDVLLDPQALDEDLIEVQHSLLLWQNVRKNSLDEASRLGALVYAKSLHRSLSVLSTHVRPLVQKLLNSIAEIGLDSNAMPLLIWLCFMGAIAVPLHSSEKGWFIQFLAAATAADRNLSTWDDVKSLLSSMLWAEKVHGQSFKRVWNEVEAMRTF